MYGENLFHVGSTELSQARHTCYCRWGGRDLPRMGRVHNLETGIAPKRE